jgi:hypothetical protein
VRSHNLTRCGMRRAPHICIAEVTPPIQELHDQLQVSIAQAPRDLPRGHPNLGINILGSVSLRSRTFEVGHGCAVSWAIHILKQCVLYVLVGAELACPPTICQLLGCMRRRKSATRFLDRIDCDLLETRFKRTIFAFDVTDRAEERGAANNICQLATTTKWSSQPPMQCSYSGVRVG